MQTDRLHSIMSIANACQAVGTGDSSDEETLGVQDTLPIPMKSLVDDLLFPMKNPQLYKLRTLSTDRLQTLFQAGHQRHISGDTLVGSDAGQTKFPCTIRDYSINDSSILDLVNMQSEDKEGHMFRELPFYCASLYDSEEERIRAEVQAEWKAAFKFMGRKNHQNILDIQEDHMDDLKRVDRRYGAMQRQGQHYKRQRDAAMAELHVVKQEREDLKENLGLDTFSCETAKLQNEIARLLGLMEYGRQIGLEQVMCLEYELEEQHVTNSAVFQENAELKNELAELSEERQFLWSERAADKAALKDLLEQMDPLEDELAEAKAKNDEMKDNWARDSEALDDISEQKAKLENQLAAAATENNALRANQATSNGALDVEEQDAGRQQLDTGNGSIDELIHLALQLLARMQYLDTELRNQGFDMYNAERESLMSFCCEALRPHGVNTMALIADDEAQQGAATATAAAPSPSTTSSDLWLQQNKAVPQKKEHTNERVETPRDRMLREATEDPDFLVNHDAQGGALRVETRGSYSPIELGWCESSTPARSWEDMLP